MPKITTTAEKQILLAKMEQDRVELADAVARASTQTKTSNGWASTTALAAGAVAGWPKILRKPLRAMAAMSLKARLNEILVNRLNRRDLEKRNLPVPADPKLARLAQLTADLRHAVEQVAAAEEIERIRRELEEEVQRIRARKEREAMAAIVTPAVAPKPAAAVVPGSVEEAIVEARRETNAVKAPPSGY